MRRILRQMKIRIVQSTSRLTDQSYSPFNGPITGPPATGIKLVVGRDNFGLVVYTCSYMLRLVVSRVLRVGTFALVVDKEDAETSSNWNVG